ncbi:hypothetical protein [Bacillus sp. T2.9-1]|uniref:hypothetical protein n=1 Tax=Bacillus sp. T2.9-1 TaxID=3041163 RepID=UPI002542565F|nr:hypothetical protein [Bacillus sp. T2.9-1]
MKIFRVKVIILLITILMGEMNLLLRKRFISDILNLKTINLSLYANLCSESNMYEIEGYHGNHL